MFELKNVQHKIREEKKQKLCIFMETKKVQAAPMLNNRLSFCSLLNNILFQNILYFTFYWFHMEIYAF